VGEAAATDYRENVDVLIYLGLLHLLSPVEVILTSSIKHVWSCTY
jgi:hypothetical protein